MNIQKLVDKYKSFHKYKDPFCDICKGTGKVSFYGRTAIDISGHNRCNCSQIQSKKYKKYLDKRNKYLKKYSLSDIKMLNRLWVDNNKSCDYENNAVDRSW